MLKKGFGEFNQLAAVRPSWGYSELIRILLKELSKMGHILLPGILAVFVGAQLQELTNLCICHPGVAAKV